MYKVRTHVSVRNTSGEIQTINDLVYKRITFAPSEEKLIPIQVWCRHRRRCAPWAERTEEDFGVAGEKLRPFRKAATVMSSEYSTEVDLEDRETPSVRVKRSPRKRMAL